MPEGVASEGHDETAWHGGLPRLLGAACAAFFAGLVATALLGGVLSFLPADASKALTSGTFFVYVFVLVFFAAAMAVGATVLDGGRPHLAPPRAPTFRPRQLQPGLASPEDADVIAFARRPRAPSKNTWLTFGVTFVLFAAWLGSGGSTFASGIALMATLLFHEAGHWVAMRIFGYRDSRIFFVPFPCAATSGKKVGAPGWQECTVLLMGPLPGLVLATLLSPMALTLRLTTFATALSWLHTAMTSLVVVNLLNLLPLAALDGGRMWMRLLFSRRPVLEVVADAAMAAGLGLLGWKLSWWVLVGIGALSLVTIAPRYRIASAGLRARTRGLVAAPDLESAPNEYLEDLRAEVREAFQNRPMKPAVEVSWMRNLHERLASGPMGTGATLLFLGFYFLAVLVGIAGIILLVSDTSTAQSAAITERQATKNGLLVAHYPADFAVEPGSSGLTVRRDSGKAREEMVAWIALTGNVTDDLASWSDPLLTKIAGNMAAIHEPWAEISRVPGPCFRSYPGLLVSATHSGAKGTWNVRMCFFATSNARYVRETRVAPAQEASDLPLLQKILDATELK